MGTTQKYSLKWNDFTVNVASTFRDLHSRQDFVDVTLACSDGTTLDAHRVILSSVSTYFRDILRKVEIHQHPIIILNNTGRDEAAAMLEFAYTGEVNVAQDLLPSLLSTARSFRIKGLDKVQSPIDVPPIPARLDSHTPSSEHWGAESAPATRSHSPSSIHSQDVKPHFEHFLADEKINGHVSRREREISPPRSVGGSSSRPPTRETSPSGQNPRTPPPKRWKRSFDLTNPQAAPEAHKENGDQQPLPMVAENYSTRGDYEPSKRYCEPGMINGRYAVSQSLPTSPITTMYSREQRHSALLRHHPISPDVASRPPQATSPLPRPESTTQTQPDAPVDYRCFNNQTKSEDDYHGNGHRASVTTNGADSAAEQSLRRHIHDDDEDEEDHDPRYRRPGLFRSGSAPPMDMTPDDGSMSGPPSLRNGDHDDDEHDHMHNGDDEHDCFGKGYNLTPDAMGRYNCDECGKIFKHPGSLQHHRHIHRGTHRCPSCGKAFSRRWDMERHLNKSKYGCPANRFSTGSAGSTGSSSGGTTAAAHGHALTNGGAVSLVTGGGGGVSVSVTGGHLELLSAASSLHNTTA